MAAHSNRSPSPLCSRPTNPNPRNSENNSATRRSFSGSNPFSKPSVQTNSRRFDPITPANSPSDFARNRSVGKEWTGSCLKDCEEKENDEKDHVLKASKLHPPAKGCKNFMSPTISAASKFTPSPRKKVLVERNDPVRTSISLSDGKAMFFSNMSSTVSEDQMLEPKSEMGYHLNQKTERSFDSKVADSEKEKVVLESNPVSKPSKRVSFSDIPSDSQPANESLLESVITDSDSLNLESIVTDSDSLNLESGLKNNVVSPSIAPLDADPSLPPYDPKTNYLSPRPQFLHYKPNPRIEILLNKEKGLDPEEVKKLEDSLTAEIMSENFSDSEGTEESQTEDLRNEEIEAISSADMVEGFDEIEADSHVSEPSESLPVSTSINDTICEEDLVQKNEKKSRAFFRMMCFSTVLMLFIVCVSVFVIHSPSVDEFVINDLSLSDLSNFYQQSRTAAAASAKVSFDRLTKRVNQFSVSSISFISKLANELREGEKRVPLQFMNLSEVHRKTWNEGNFLNNGASRELVEILEEEDGLEEERDTEMDTFEEEEYADIDSDEKFEEGFDTQDDILEEDGLEEEMDTEMDTFEEEEYADIDSDEKFEEGFYTQDDVLVTETDSYGEEAYAEVDADEEFEKGLETQNDHPVKLAELESECSQDIQSQREMISSINAKELNELNSMDQETVLEAEIDVASDTILSDHNSPSDVNTQSENVQASSEDNSFAHRVIGISSLVASLLAIASFIFQYKRNPSTAYVVQSNDPLSTREKAYGFSGTKHIYQEKEFSQNLQTEVDVIGGESCPSEMSSSFQRSASYSKKAANEVQSSEKKTRKFSKRESLASSSDYSTGSPSYGSFTTYERFPNKYADGEEEIVTPVRRSSRLRNHQLSSP